MTKFIIRTFITLFFVILFGCETGGNIEAPPADAFFVEYLNKNEVSLAYIAERIAKHDKLYRVRLVNNDVETRPAGIQLEPEISNLIRDLELELVDLGVDSNRSLQIEFFLYISGFVFGGEMKALVYAKKTPSDGEIVSDLDVFRERMYQNHQTKYSQVYRHIKGHWYILYKDQR